MRGCVDAFLIVFWIIVAGLGIIGLASTSGRLGSEVVGNVGVIFVRIFSDLFSFLFCYQYTLVIWMMVMKSATNSHLFLVFLYLPSPAWAGYWQLPIATLRNP